MKAGDLVIADFSARDVDRLLTFLHIAKETGRKLVILPKDAYLLKTMRLLDPEIPDVATDDGICIYQDTIALNIPVYGYETSVRSVKVRLYWLKMPGRIRISSFYASVSSISMSYPA